MSRDNHKRKEARKLEHLRRRWGCKKLGCDFAFIPASVLRADKADRARQGHRRAGPLVAVCAACNTFHLIDDDRNGVRLMTPAELLRLHVDVPAAAEAAETYKPAGTTPELHLCRVEE